MDANEARVAVDRILEQSLESLTRGSSFCFSYGLPPARTDDLLGIEAGFQESMQPESGPDGSQFYILGRYGPIEVALSIRNSLDACQLLDYLLGRVRMAMELDRAAACRGAEACRRSRDLCLAGRHN
ncbi:hypothetical protein [Streptomyces spinoverrucosus]|uniref:hypothetical protein n=1 Tax=Streptomyces spinoverrucosus TaxID=284043 RepID=UPI001E4D8086|nr:hypothetical protein [Streptomyces spinoverrucosus]